MASNSIREQIIVAEKAVLETLTTIKTVSRTRIAFSDLDTIANTQLPMLALVGKLPKPVDKLSSRQQGVPDKFISELGIDVYCYALANVDPDTMVSTLADDIWTQLFLDPTVGGLALETKITPEVQVGVWDPYIAFKMLCSITYIHGRGGI